LQERKEKRNKLASIKPIDQSKYCLRDIFLPN